MKRLVGSAKAGARDLVGDLLFRLNVTAPSRCLAANLTIVTFHRVLTPEQILDYPLPGLAVTPEELDAHLKFLTEHFRCMSLARALRDWTSVNQSGQKPLLAITFDDGQLDNFENALPVLEANGVSASFYVPSQVLENTAPLWHDEMARVVFALRDSDASDAQQLLAEFGLGEAASAFSASTSTSRETTAEWCVDQSKMWPPEKRGAFMARAGELATKLSLKRNLRPSWDGFMSTEQMRELIRRGHEIGAHSHSHALLPQVSDAELQREVVQSKHLLEAALGTTVETFCYPNGDNDTRVQDAVKSAGYRAAVTTSWGANQPGADMLTLSRCDMHAHHAQNRRGSFSASRVAWRLSGLHPGLRPTNKAML